MAGSHLPNGSEEQQQGIMLGTITTAGDHWEVQYARFFNCPSLSKSAGAGDHHPSLVPLVKKPKGLWISSFTSLAYLRLITDDSDNSRSIILTIDLVDKLVEEHYISKLHFTWPQASCLSGYPPRGSKTIFMSYKDHIGQIICHGLHCQIIDLMESIYDTPNGLSLMEYAFKARVANICCPNSSVLNIAQELGQQLEMFGPDTVFLLKLIQKFAVRFHAIDEALRFINSLKEIFGQERIDGSMYDISKSKTSSQSQIFSSPQPLNRLTEDWDPISSSADNSQPMYRPAQDWSPIASPADSFIQSILQPSEDQDTSQNSNPLKTTLDQDVQEKLSAFPPSFSSLLMNCFPAAEQATQPTVPEEVGLKNEIMKYLEDSSFQDMLIKVQKVISEFGDDLL